MDPIEPRDDGVARSRARARPDNRGWRCRVTDSRGLRTWRREEVIRTIPLGGVTARLGGLAGGLLDGRGLAHDGLLGGDLLGRGGSLLLGGSLLGRGGSLLGGALLGGRGRGLLEERVDLENSHLVVLEVVRECLVCWNSAGRARLARQVSIGNRREAKQKTRRRAISLVDKIVNPLSTEKRTENRRFIGVGIPGDNSTRSKPQNSRDPNRPRFDRCARTKRPPASVNGLGRADRGADETDRSSGDDGTRARRDDRRGAEKFYAAVAARRARHARGDIKTRALHTVVLPPRAPLRHHARCRNPSSTSLARERSVSFLVVHRITWWRGCRSPAPRCTRRPCHRTSCPRRT